MSLSGAWMALQELFFCLTASVTLIIHVHWLGREWSLILWWDNALLDASQRCFNCGGNVSYKETDLAAIALRSSNEHLCLTRTANIFVEMNIFMFMSWLVYCQIFASRKTHRGMRWVKIICASAQVCMLRTMQVFDCNPTHDQCNGKVASVSQKLSLAYLKL